MLATLLEGCRQNDAPINVEKWFPDHLREPKPVKRATPEEIKAFSHALSQGKNRR